MSLPFIKELVYEKLEPAWVCIYCGNPVSSGYEPTNFPCCGEAGHTVLVDEDGNEVEEAE
jgi:rubrerythrin